MTPEETGVNFRIVDGGTEETGFELVEVKREVKLVPADDRQEIVPVE